MYFYFVQGEQYPKEKQEMNRRLGSTLDCSGYSKWISSGEVLIDTLGRPYGCMQMHIDQSTRLRDVAVLGRSDGTCCICWPMGYRTR